MDRPVTRAHVRGELDRPSGLHDLRRLRLEVQCHPRRDRPDRSLWRGWQVAGQGPSLVPRRPNRVRWQRHCRGAERPRQPGDPREHGPLRRVGNVAQGPGSRLCVGRGHAAVPPQRMPHHRWSPLVSVLHPPIQPRHRPRHPVVGHAAHQAAPGRAEPPPHLGGRGTEGRVPAHLHQARRPLEGREGNHRELEPLSGDRTRRARRRA